MKYPLLLPLIVLGLSALTGCKASAADPNAAAFFAVSPNVASVKEVVIAGNTDLDTTITKLGGFPAAADVAVSKKAVDTQYAVGRDKDGKAIIAVSLTKDGVVTVVIDPDLITGYAAKVKTLSGEKSIASTASSTTSSGPGGGSTSATSGKPVKGSPFYIGMTMAEAQKKLGALGGVSKAGVGSGHETWYCAPAQSGDAADMAIGQAVGATGVFGGVFGGAAHNKVKLRSYVIKFTGDVISEVDVNER